MKHIFLVLSLMIFSAISLQAQKKRELIAQIDNLKSQLDSVKSQVSDVYQEGLTNRQ